MVPVYRLPMGYSDEVEINLSDTDEAILGVLEEGRGTPRFISNSIGKSRPHVTNRLKRLVEHNVVELIDRGLYESNVLREGDDE